MSNNISACCGAEMTFASYDPKLEPYPTLCTACGKPCGVESEEVPASRLLTVSDIGEAYDKAEAHLSKADDATRKYGWDLENRRFLLQAQDSKTSALVRAECQEENIRLVNEVVGLVTEVRELQAAHKKEVVELRDALEGILGYAEEYHFAFEGENGKTRNWYLQAVSHAQEVFEKYKAIKASVEEK